MPGSAFLHIQDRESSPIRVVELPWISVRIGRAAYCEVRLTGADLAAEVCRLQRRGQTWSIIPLTRSDQVWLDGRPLKGPHPLPLDVPFRVGDYALVLRKDHSTEPAWTASQPPRAPMKSAAPVSPEWSAPVAVVEPRVPEPPSVAAAPTATAPPPRPASDGLWEARWKAAAARLKPVPEAPPKPQPPRAYQPPDRYRGAPLKTPEPSAVPGASAKPPEWSAPAWASPPLKEPLAAAAPVPAESPARPAPLPEHEVAEPEPAPIRDEPVPAGSPIVEESAGGEPCGEALSTCLLDDAEATAIAPPPEPTADTPAAVEGSWTSPHEPFGQWLVAGEGAGGVSIRHDVLPGPELADPAGVQAVNLVMMPFAFDDPINLTRDDGDGPGGRRQAAPPLPPGESGRDRDPSGEPYSTAGAPRSGVRTATLLEPPPAPEPPPRAWRTGRTEARRGGTEPDLPSAREILAAAARRPSPRDERPRAAAAPAEALPTVALEPACWCPPAWAAWPPAALLVLVLGLGGSALAVHWAGESYRASVVYQRLVAQEGAPGAGKPLPEGVAPPPAAWWSTTPRHLVEWGVYLGRASAGEEPGPDARELLEGAVRIAPLHPAARLARAEGASGATAPDRPALGLSLGLSRDAVSLGWSARALRLAGKKEAALRGYRQALEIACRVDGSAGYAPSFSEDPGVRRYLLPGEPAALEIARDLVEDADWAFQDWSPAVPAGTTAELAAARLLHEKGRPEARPLLERLAEARIAEPASGEGPAIRLAIKAEACALLARWREAEQAYRQAVEEAGDLTTRRSWWFNLASVALQLDDQRQHDAALQAALEVSTSDDISRRALELRRSSEPLARLHPGGTKAN
jgi:tetratricopeptide (TPR) repeat protein